MKKLILISLVMATLGFTACERDHYIDGGLHSRELDKSTYDFIASRSDQFSKVKYIIDHEGLQDLVNQTGNTVFVPQDESIEEYVIQRKLDHLQFEKLPEEEMDTLGMQLKRYIFNERIERDALSLKEKWFIASSASEPTSYLDSMRVALQIYTDHNGSSDYGPKIVVLTGINKFYNKNTERFEFVRKQSRVSSSNLLSTNGVVHVIEDQHIFGF